MTDLRHGVTESTHDVLDLLDASRESWAAHEEAERLRLSIRQLDPEDVEECRAITILKAARAIHALEIFDAEVPQCGS